MPEKPNESFSFYWQTQLTCEQAGQTLTIRGARGSAIITTPTDCPVRIETLPFAKAGKNNASPLKSPEPPANWPST